MDDDLLGTGAGAAIGAGLAGYLLRRKPNKPDDGFGSGAILWEGRVYYHGGHPYRIQQERLDTVRLVVSDQGLLCHSIDDARRFFIPRADLRGTFAISDRVHVDFTFDGSNNGLIVQSVALRGSRAAEHLRQSIGTLIPQKAAAPNLRRMSAILELTRTLSCLQSVRGRELRDLYYVGGHPHARRPHGYWSPSWRLVIGPPALVCYGGSRRLFEIPFEHFTGASMEQKDSLLWPRGAQLSIRFGANEHEHTARFVVAGESAEQRATLFRDELLRFMAGANAPSDADAASSATRYCGKCGVRIETVKDRYCRKCAHRIP